MESFLPRGYHIGFTDACGAKYALLPGDPGRVESIARLLENPRFHAQNREYTSWLGEVGGETVLVMSTGMGGPSTAIAVEELAVAGVKTLLRVGTCGGMDLGVMGGDVVIANAAIRMEGTTREYAPLEFPAVADLEVTNALVLAADALSAQRHVGVVHCKDSFYGQHDPARMPIAGELQSKWDAWVRAGALASEMESAALYIVAGTLRLRAGCVLMAVWNQERARLGLPNTDSHDTTLACRVAVEAVKILIEKEVC
ncbi:MAG: uridine phosphorylase [Oscillospiraceae bacterium]|jgi:uridine phosphorylase|nr:uridine phosphorylase [Oscillospiraceae bacterium]